MDNDDTSQLIVVMMYDQIEVVGVNMYITFFMAEF